MRPISAASELLVASVRALFQNPHHHYTFVVQRDNNFLYFYDDKTMTCIGVSKGPIHETIKFLVFSNNYGEFVAYFDGTNNGVSARPNPFIVHFRLDGHDKISSTKHLVK